MSNNREKRNQSGEVSRSVVLAVVITAVVVGVVMYIWQDSRVRATEMQFQGDIDQLREQVEHLNRILTGGEIEEVQEEVDQE